ncbi:mucin-binding protein [Lactobacillus amylovorus]|uniref:mucin-binding protein n=1 Tax=Lactobacillus amylovorus TaxID=1604 RepID=UPI00232DA804|nr:YSIRK-type signal peptide-containing protein [Lactobacillus amylovorus]MDB6232418.1 YSIRK-type signal peptide-containing protein [Lactobacillus amylovorus]
MNNKHLFDEKQRFSLRKLTVGLASVLVGLTLFGTAQTANSQTVHAATITHEKNGDDVIDEEPALDPSTGEPKHETIGVDYEAQDQKQTIHYHTSDGQPAKDKDGNPVPDGHVTGKTDDKGKDVPMPDGYIPQTPGKDDKTDLTNPDPTTGKVPDKTVTVEHGQHTTAPGETHKVGDPITPNPNDPKDAKKPGNTYQQAITDQDVKKDLTRTVTINKPKADGNTVIDKDNHQHIDLAPETKSSTVSYHRTATVDDVTGKVTGYGNWQLVDPSKNQFAGVDVPIVDGYTAHITDGEGHTLSSIAPENAPTTDDAIEHYQSPKIVINYTANNQSVKYIFKDGDSDVLDGTVSGVTGQTVDSKTALAGVIEQLTGKGYDMSKVTIDPYKFKAHNVDITIDLADDHGIIKGVDPNPGGQNPDVPGDTTKIPEDLKDTDGHKVTLEDTRKEITRSITASEPTGDNENARSNKDLSQRGVVTRTFDYDPVTKTITKWNEWRPVSWDAVTVPDHAGYTATITDGDGHTLTSIDKVTTSDPSYKDPKISITYTANRQSRKYDFRDDGKTVVQKEVRGVTDQTVDPSTQLDDVMNTLKGKGYDLSKIDLGGSYKFKAFDNSDNIIDLSGAHGSKDVQPGDTIPDGVTDPKKSGSDKHVTDRDVTETVTRHITFHDPTHENSTSTKERHVDQAATLKRGFTYDTVTKQVTKYGDWTTQDVPPVDVPKVAGYKVAVTGVDLQDGKIPADTLRDGYTDPKIEVTYTATDSTQTIHYVDENGHELPATDNKDQNGDVIKDSTVTVKTDEVGNVQVPKGWKLVDDHDKTTKVAYGNDGKIPVKNVAITHATIEVTPDKPHKQGDPIDPKVPTGSKYGDGLTSDDLNDVAYREIHFKLPASTKAEDYAKRLKANGLSSATVEGTNSVVVRQEVAYKRTAIVDAITGEVKGYNPAGINNQGWVPSADKLVDAYIKNGSAVFNKVLIPQITGYKAHIDDTKVTITKLADGSRATLSQLFVSFMAIPAPKDGNSTGAINKEKVKPDDTKPGDAKSDTTPVKDLTKDDQKKIADDTKPGKGDDTKPGKPDDTKPSKTDDTKPGNVDDTKPGKVDDTKPGNVDNTKSGNVDKTKPGKSNTTKLGKKSHVSPIVGHDSGANKKNSKITNTAASASDKSNRNTPIGSANDEANETNRTVQAAVVNSDKKVLPQTGASQKKIGIIGMVFASLAGMLGLAGTKKKRKND